MRKQRCGIHYAICVNASTGILVVPRRVLQSIAHCQAILMLTLSHYFRVLDSRQSIICILAIIIPIAIFTYNLGRQKAL